MINPTQEDIGRRVRWLGHNFGRLLAFKGDHATVLFEYEAVPCPGLDLTALNWADGNLGKINTGSKEPTEHPRKAFRNSPPGLWRDRLA